MIVIILISLGLIGLLIGSYTDAKTREVPDWLNFSLIAAGLGIRAIYSALSFDLTIIVEGLFGFAIALVLGYIMFYAGQWGGGDSKMIMALGAILGMPFSLTPFPLFLIFLVNILIVGAIYGLGFSIVLGIIHKKQFIKYLTKSMKEPIFKKVRKIGMISSILIIILVLMFIQNTSLMWLCIAFTAFAYMSLYLVMLIKAIEKAAMFRNVDPKTITEGEWIAKDYYDGKKRICGPKDLGISKKQIKQMIALQRKGKIKKIKIKIGIPFVPSFLISYIVMLLFGVWWVAIL